MEANTGHHAKHVGLQNHGVSACYPYGVVAKGDDNMEYFVVNFETGEALSHFDGRNVWRFVHLHNAVDMLGIVELSNNPDHRYKWVPFIVPRVSVSDVPRSMFHKH